MDVPQIRRAFQSTERKALQHVFCFVTVTQAPAQKSQQIFPRLNQGSPHRSVCSLDRQRSVLRAPATLLVIFRSGRHELTRAAFLQVIDAAARHSLHPAHPFLAEKK
jgi:hypothetical protein